MSTESEIVDSITGLVKAVPVYEDMLQPAAKELGKSLETVTKIVNVALAPVSLMVWGYDQIKDFISTKVAERLKNVPPENIVPPKLNIAGPAIEALRFTGHEPSLSDLYANLLAAAMDKETASGAHPAFVEIIKQLTPDEAKIIGLFNTPMSYPLITVRKEYKVETVEQKGGHDVVVNFSLWGKQIGLEYPHLTPMYIDNLCRLGLAEIPTSKQYMTVGIYDSLENDEEMQKIKLEIESSEIWKCTFERKFLNVTQLGRQFSQTCAIHKN